MSNSDCVRSYAWAFTWNNYPGSSDDVLSKLKYRHLVYGRETGESGTPHLQGNVVFKSQKTKTAVIKALPGCHVSVCRDVDASIAYCKKSGDFKEFGEYKSRTRNALDQTARRAERNKILCSRPIKELVDSGLIALSQASVIEKCRNVYFAAQTPYKHPTERGLWFYGPPRTGKTRTARETYPDAYIKAQNKWFDGYSSQEAIILDDLDSEHMGHLLKIWLDMHPCSGETKGGHVELQHRVFVVTSNYTPEELFKDKICAAAIRSRCQFIKFADSKFKGGRLKPIHVTADVDTRVSESPKSPTADQPA